MGVFLFEEREGISDAEEVDGLDCWLFLANGNGWGRDRNAGGRKKNGTNCTQSRRKARDRKQ